MNKFFDNMYTIYNNTFIFTPLLVKFYKNMPKQKNNILLAYLVFPLVLYGASKKNLQRVLPSSNIHTFIDTKNKAKRENLFGLQERIDDYQELTNKCLQHAISCNFIKIENDMSITFLKDSNNKVAFLLESFKASSNLYKVFKDLDVVIIYRLLGVKKI